ncbi:MAG: hypothetical protein ABSB76_07425, partial [Streptosporangiaceae bacterium]
MRLGPHASEAQKVTEADDVAEPVPAPRLDSGGRAGWLLAAVTVVPAMLAAAWLLPGLPLVLAGRFAGLPMVLMFVPLAAVLCYFAVRQHPACWPGFRPDRPAPGHPAADRPGPDHLASEHPAPDRPGPDHLASEHPAPDRPGPDHLASEHPA